MRQKSCFFEDQLAFISSVWDVFNRIQSYLEPGNLKSSFFGNFKFEANFAQFLASKNDYSHKSAIFSWKKPKWSKKDENMYKVYRKYKKNGFQNTLKMAKMCSLRGTVPPSGGWRNMWTAPYHGCQDCALNGFRKIATKIWKLADAHNHTLFKTIWQITSWKVRPTQSLQNLVEWE